MHYEVDDSVGETKYYPPKKRFLEKAEMVRIKKRSFNMILYYLIAFLLNLFNKL